MERKRANRGPEVARPTPDPTSGGEHASDLRIKLLGGLDLRLGDEPVGPVGSVRAEALLAHLLLHRDAPQPRQGLAFLLWPDSTEAQARTNLRHVLHTLRRALPDADRFLDVRQRTLQWRADAPFWLDVAAFEQAAAEGQLEEAADTYTGDLLEGSYDEWLLEERERLAQLYLDVLERLVRRLEDEGRLSEAIRRAERLLRQDVLREESYRLLMRLYDTSGERARALRAYHECETTLQRELGVQPSAATRQAYEALLPEAVEEGEEPIPGSAGRVPLVGRATERARLAELWHAADGGAAQLVLVTGEAGVGKTRLVDELRAWCAHRGALTAEARAYRMEGALAYAGVAAWLRAERISERVRRLDRAHVTELARLLPELLTEIPGLAAPERLPESEQRRRLFEAAAHALRATGASHLLVADDLQWFDEQTLRFVHFLLRTHPDARLLVAATARRDEVDARHAVAELASGVQALGRFAEVALGRLSREETELLAERALGRSLPEKAAGRLYVESEGNPLFVLEALGAEGQTGRRAGAPSRGDAIIRSRLAQLSDPAAELAGLAAAFGREFPTQVLAEASDLDEGALVRSLDELWQRGIVRARGAGGYDFRHGKIRDAAYEALGPVRAQHHHLRIAQSLERRRAANAEVQSGQIAVHYDRAGSAAEAVEWYARAAESAQRLYAHTEAVAALERALELIPSLPAGRDRDALELRLLASLPTPLVAVQGYLSRRVAEVHARGLELTRSLDAEPEPPFVRSLALASLARGDFAAARAFGEEIRTRARREVDEVLWVESAYVLAIVAYWQGQLEEARAGFEDAIRRCRPEHRTAHLLHYAQDPEIVCVTRLAHTLWILGRVGESERLRDEGLELAETRGHEYSRTVALSWSAFLAVDQRDWPRLGAYTQKLCRDYPAYDAPQIRIVADALSGLLEVVEGGTEHGTGLVERVVGAALRDEPATPGFHALLLRMLLEAYAAAGSTEIGLRTADEALAMGRGTQLWEAEIRRLRAEFLAASGASSDEVAAELRRALKTAQRQRARSFEARIRSSADAHGLGTLGGTVSERPAADDRRDAHSKEADDGDR